MFSLPKGEGEEEEGAILATSILTAISIFFVLVLVSVWLKYGKRLSTTGSALLSVYHIMILGVAVLVVQDCTPGGAFYLQVILAVSWAVAGLISLANRVEMTAGPKLTNGPQWEGLFY